MLLSHSFPQKGNREIMLNYFLLGLCCGCHIPLVIWIVSWTEDFLEVVAINGRIILKSILKE
jgi:hypothetical protein